MPRLPGAHGQPRRAASIPRRREPREPSGDCCLPAPGGAFRARGVSGYPRRRPWRRGAGHVAAQQAGGVAARCYSYAAALRDGAGAAPAAETLPNRTARVAPVTPLTAPPLNAAPKVRSPRARSTTPGVYRNRRLFGTYVAETHILIVARSDTSVCARPLRSALDLIPPSPLSLCRG